MNASGVALLTIDLKGLTPDKDSSSAASPTPERWWDYTQVRFLS